MKITPPQLREWDQAAVLLQDGDNLALGGMTLYRRPVAFVLDLLRQERPPQDLTLLCFTAGYESDLLVGAGCVSTVRTCYFGLEIFGLAPMFTAAANKGAVRIVEESEASLALGIRATMQGVNFLASKAWLGTDLPRLRPDVKMINDPYDKAASLMAFPAIEVDMAVIHARHVDPLGNAQLNSNYGVDRELALIAKHVIITTEEILEQPCTSIDIPAALVTAILHYPRGAWPTSCYPNYPVDGREILRYIDACNAGDFDTYISNFKHPPTI